MQARQIICYLLHFLPGFMPSSSQDADCPCTMQETVNKHPWNVQARQCLSPDQQLAAMQHRSGMDQQCAEHGGSCPAPA